MLPNFFFFIFSILLEMLRRAGGPSLLDKRGKDDATERRIQILHGGIPFAARHLQQGSNATATADQETKLKSTDDGKQ